MIDLHCHTKISDNSLTMEEVITRAKRVGITSLGITDHDTTVGLARAIRLGEEIGVEVIPGIEISAFDYKRESRAHILGYYVKPGSESIKNLCDPLMAKRHEASFLMVEKIIAAGYEITWAEVEHFAKGGTGVYKQHIMHALLVKGYTDRIYGSLYKELFFRGNETEKPGVAFIPIEYMDAKDAIRVIKEAGGVPVLAHPGQFNNFDAVPEWVKAGLEGIEFEHPLHSETDKMKVKELASQFNLVMTGGSDFHGFYGDAETEIGDFTTSKESLQELKNRIKISIR